jgi:hypothetical protein
MNQRKSRNVQCIFDIFDGIAVKILSTAALVIRAGDCRTCPGVICYDKRAK